MATYDSAVALARRLIDKKGGRTVLIKAGSPVTPDEDKPWEQESSDPATTSKTIKAVFLDFASLGSAPKRFADGTLVQEGDKQVYLSASSLGSIVVGLNDILQRADGSRWIVKTAKLLDPDGQKILWEVWVKQ